PRLLTYGITDDQAWEVGLPCGGEIDVFVQRLERELPPAGEGALLTALEGSRAGEHWLVENGAIEGPSRVLELKGEKVFAEVTGSRKPQAKRRERVLEAGLSVAALERLAGPAGLDLGADSPAETAVSILGEILAVRAGRAGGRLVERSGPIHAGA